MKTLCSICCVLLAVATGTSNVFGQVTEDAARNLKLSTGMYAVLKMDDRAEALQDVRKDQKIVKYVRDVGWGDTQQAYSFLLLNAKPDVPLRLTAEPVVVKDNKDDERLNVRLFDDGSDKLLRFTENHIGRKAAVVVDGQVVFLATIRTPIKGPKLQVSFCKSGGAEHLKTQLTKLLTKTTK